MSHSNISFTSNIKFVSREAYARILKNENPVRIGYLHNEPNVLKSNNFYSDAIRTCTGGGLVSPFSEAEGFHLLNDEKNYKNLGSIINSMFRYVRNPERGLLIGSKSIVNLKYSVEQFQRVKNVFQERVKNISLFENHKYRSSGSDYHYSLASDTWSIYAKFKPEDDIEFQTVDSLKKLRECYEKIHIANGDRLFIGEKEITQKDAPDLF